MELTKEELASIATGRLNDSLNEAKARVLSLRERQREVSRSIDQAAVECQQGMIPGSVRLNQLAAEKSQVDRALITAESDQATAQAELDRLTAKVENLRFDEVLVMIEDQRTKVIEHVREAALAAGSIHELLKEARSLAGGRRSPKWAFVEEASRVIRPYADWEISYIAVDIDAVTIKILPVKKL
jgi:seryl-tRNA synthetase